MASIAAIEDDMPKSAARILNAERVQKEWHERKRKEREEEQEGGKKKRKTEGGETTIEWNKHLKVAIICLLQRKLTGFLSR